SHLSLVHSLSVSVAGSAADLDWSLPADDREALGLRAAICAVDSLFTGCSGDYGTACGPTRRLERTAHSADPRRFVHRDCDSDPGVARPGPGEGNCGRPVPANLRQPGIAAALGAARLLHLSLSLPRTDHQGKPDCGHVRGRGAGGLSLRDSPARRLGQRALWISRGGRGSDPDSGANPARRAAARLARAKFPDAVSTRDGALPRRRSPDWRARRTVSAVGRSAGGNRIANLEGTIATRGRTSPTPLR